MARNHGRRIVAFRIPFFRIFYSVTYTTLYLICLLMLAITPISLIWSAIQHKVYQYVFMVGGSYVLTAIVAIFIYSSRLYTNRSTLAAVGKAYVPIEEGEVGSLVRKMIMKQMERSAIVAWEGRPRDLYGEILFAEKEGFLPPESRSVGHNDYTVGRIISVDPPNPPWGDIQHDGWSSPSHGDENKYPDVRFADVIEELPHLIEARAVSLAPLDHLAKTGDGDPLVPDAEVIELLQRPASMALREYMTQLSYLGLFQPPSLAPQFLVHYERARFSGRPVPGREFSRLMTAFSDLIAGMETPAHAIIKAIHAKAAEKYFVDGPNAVSSDSLVEEREGSVKMYLPPTASVNSGPRNPAALPEANSRSVASFQSQASNSEVSLSSVVHQQADEASSQSQEGFDLGSGKAASFTSIPSDVGSVLRYDAGSTHG